MAQRTNDGAAGNGRSGPLREIQERLAHLAEMLDLVGLTRLDDEQRRTMAAARKEARELLRMLESLRAKR